MVGDILQPTHLLFVLVIALLVLGPKRLPEVGRSLGRGLRDFRSAMSGDDDHAGFMTESTVEAQPAPAEPVVTTDAAATTEAEADTPPLAAAATAAGEPSQQSD